MAKQMDFIRLLIEGDVNGPNTARFVYRVCDDSDSQMAKTVHYEITSPVFDLDTIQEFFDGYVAVFESDEGIL